METMKMLAIARLYGYFIISGDDNWAKINKLPLVL